MAACGRRGVAARAHDEGRELALLYRPTAADLSSAREDPNSAALTRYLNELLGRAHNLVYAGAARSRPASAVHFIVHGFPAVVRETLPFTLAAFALFVVGGLAGALVAASDPGFERFILNGQMIDTIERREMWTHGIVAVKPYASSAIMTNNIAVSLAACATGMLAGLGPVYMMLFNGLLIGVVASACQRAGMSVELWSFVAPHGALELPAIFIAGGAGLVLAAGILFPGRLPRRDSEALARVGDEPAGQRQCGDDHRQRDRVEQVVGEAVRRDGVDIEIGEHEQERPPEAERQQGRDEADEGEVTLAPGDSLTL